MRGKKEKAEEILRGWKGENYAFGTDVIGKLASRFGGRALLVTNGSGWLSPWLDEVDRSLREEGLSGRTLPRTKCTG